MRRRRVLLLEAGRDWRSADAPPALRSANIIPFMHDPAHQAEWQWPELMARRTAVQEPKFYWRGRALGGSSAVNAQIAIRGVPEAFDNWAEAGCEGWSAKDVLPLFDRIEDDADMGTVPGIRRGGPLPVYRTPMDRWGAVDRGLWDAALAVGYPWKADLNAPEGEGVSCYPINSRDGQRVTTNDAISGAGARAGESGDPRRRAGGPRVVRWDARDWCARSDRRCVGGDPAREVVLSAGAIHSPAILMRSGIGAALALQGLGIPVVVDLPGVGRNLMDHPVIRATLDLTPEHRAKGADARHTNCCVTYSSRLGGGGERDMILVAFNHRMGIGPEPGPTGAVAALVYDAFSRGEVRLASADPTVDPVVELNMLSDERDLLRMRDAVRRLARLMAHPGLAGLCDAVRLGETEIGIGDAAALPEAALDALLLQEAGDGQHAAGTCAMSAYEDQRGVVDPDLRVRGVEGLLVCDASIMPTDCRANLHVTCVMIGENLAQRMG